MRIPTWRWASALLFVTAAIVAAGLHFFKDGTRDAGNFPVEQATPDGITIQRIGELPQGKVYPYLQRFNRKMAFADRRGLTLYVYDGKQLLDTHPCTTPCMRTWAPAIAAVGARGVPSWTVITAADGAKQWAYNSRAAYTLSVDHAPGDANGKGDWKALTLHLSSEIPMPPEITVQEVANANGQTLVDLSGRTLYYWNDQTPAKSGDCDAAHACSSHWKPTLAAATARPIGKFSAMRRKDGWTQWVFDGHALYSFDGDLGAGDANGSKVDARWRAAVVREYFLPPNVSIRDSLAHGTVLTTSSGMTLYKRDAYKFGAGEYGFFSSMPTRPTVGRQIGAKGCEGHCLVKWKPLRASETAQPSGYWEILKRSDGTRQWVYQGYPLYTHSEDKNPGEISGNEIYDLIVSDDPKVRADTLTYMEGAGALVWTYISP